MSTGLELPAPARRRGGAADDTSSDSDSSDSDTDDLLKKKTGAAQKKPRPKKPAVPQRRGGAAAGGTKTKGGADSDSDDDDDDDDSDDETTTTTKKTNKNKKKQKQKQQQTAKTKGANKKKNTEKGGGGGGVKTKGGDSDGSSDDGSSSDDDAEAEAAAKRAARKRQRDRDDAAAFKKEQAQRQRAGGPFAPNAPWRRYKVSSMAASVLTFVAAVTCFQWSCLFAHLCFVDEDPGVPQPMTNWVVPIIVLALLAAPANHLLTMSEMPRLLIAFGVLTFTWAVFVFVLGCMCFAEAEDGPSKTRAETAWTDSPFEDSVIRQYYAGGTSDLQAKLQFNLQSLGGCAMALSLLQMWHGLSSVLFGCNIARG